MIADCCCRRMARERPAPAHHRLSASRIAPSARSNCWPRLNSTPRRLADLARELYQGLPPQMMGLAELQVMAGLHKLYDEGRVQRTVSENVALWFRRITA